MRHYCTLFNMKYAAKGLALYESLARHSSAPFQLSVVAMDEDTFQFLGRTRELRPHMYVFRASEVFDSRFEKAAAGKTIAFRCFMATPWIMEWFISNAYLQEITYLDADLCFYADPERVHKEIDGRSVAIVPHRFMAHDVARLSPNGWYNVSWVTFRRDMHGSAILARWLEQCLDKCDRESCGDQKYLDEWPALLGENLCVLEDIGIGVAPWNAAAYRFVEGPAILRGNDYGAREWPVVFYHFHELQRVGPGNYRLTGYPLPDECQRLIYKPYLESLEAFQKVIDVYERNLSC